MKPRDTLDDLREWAEAHAPVGHLQAIRVRKLLKALAASRRLNVALAERVKAQSELLTRKAEAK